MLFHDFDAPIPAAVSWIRRNQRPVVSARFLPWTTRKSKPRFSLAPKSSFSNSMIEALWGSLKHALALVASALHPR
jgi:hypothetical protein